VIGNLGRNAEGSESSENMGLEIGSLDRGADVLEVFENTEIGK
jgi:hypothetical protein